MPEERHKQSSGNTTNNNLVNIISGMAFQLSKATPKAAYRSLLKTLARQKTRAVTKPFAGGKTPPTQHQTHISIYNYNADHIQHHRTTNIDECLSFQPSPHVSWINMDGLDDEQINRIASAFGIHWLIQEDISTHGQRPKADEIEGYLYAVLYMLFVDPATNEIQQEQISIVLGNNVVLSFQEDAHKDVFDPIRKRLHKADSRERGRGPDYLFYMLIDHITDSYLSVIENLGTQIESIEETILQRHSPHVFEKISQLRKDIILLKRILAPVRDLVSSLSRSESPLLEERTAKYFRDVHDHVTQANDLIDNYRDLILGLQDMYVNNVNLRMNEVMKTLAIITAIMAPATVIGGIFGMNFDIIPYAHHRWGFYGTILIMVLVPLLMIYWFHRRGWFMRETLRNSTHPPSSQ
jgi:magnesium transporter